MIEWYDFYIFGSLAGLISTKFFPQDNPTAAFLSTLATFAAGFVVRPFGALFFGRLGDLIGRKYTFMVTLVLMGGATFLIGCVPSYETIGFMAPLLVLVLRLLQGLALGGEYGGAATYVAEHAKNNTRGYLTSWIQTTATIGLFISLLVIMTTKNMMSKEAFDDWGWRVPFWVSILMLVVSYFIRRTMHESPMFQKAKDTGDISKNPLAESFGKRYNFKYVLLALLGATMGQGVIWYTGHYYSMNFLKNDCKVDGIQVEEIVAFSLLFGTPFFVFFGWLSDKIGRKPIMLAGMLIAILSYFPIYNAMYGKATNSHRTELVDQTTVSVTMAADKTNPADSIRTTRTHKVFADGAVFDETKDEVIYADTAKEAAKPKIKSSTVLPGSDYWSLIWLIFIQIIFVTMVYGPIAAFLVELFPTRIRYTSMSLPYHIGNGVFGGLMPAVALYLTNTAKEANSDGWYLQGLWYPIIIASVCFVIGLLFINNRSHTTIED
jgi:MFS family permease